MTKYYIKIDNMVVCLYVICDDARYYRSKAVQEYLETSRIKLVFLSPYAPNLNLIERFWKRLFMGSRLVEEDDSR